VKKLIILMACIQLSYNVEAQNTINGKVQLNAGLGLSQYGLPVYLGLDFGVHPDISLGIEGSYRRHTNSNYNANLLGIGGNINYHFNSLFKIKDNHWDVYAGATLGYWIWNWDNNFSGANESGVGLSGQVGGRYFFSPKWAINLELGGGTLSGGKLGVTHRF
jgi:outer membrane immunogenic protein